MRTKTLKEIDRLNLVIRIYAEVSGLFSRHINDNSFLGKTVDNYVNELLDKMCAMCGPFNNMVTKFYGDPISVKEYIERTIREISDHLLTNYNRKI